MNYQFYSRDSKGRSSIAATATVGVDIKGNASVEWSGWQANKIKSWLERDTFLMLGGDNKFNPSLAEHWRKLPEIVSGQRLWVVVE